MMDTTRIPIEERLRTEPVAWLSSTRPDGRPHVVPIWFVWDGRSIVGFSKPGAQKVKNIQSHGDVMLALGEADEDFDVELIEGCGEVLDQPTTEVLPPQLLDKYAPLMEKAGLTPEVYAKTYSQPFRITPTRILGYGGRDWLEPAEPQSVQGHLLAPGGLPRDPGQAAELIDVLRRHRRSGAALAALED